jgi:NAD(P)-dependent dehydrogenase (short-subunit alcohol dehydrogenase family)
MEKNIVVLGGTGAVGEGLVKGFMAQGAHVTVLATSIEKIRELKNYVADVATGSLEIAPFRIENEEDVKSVQLWFEHKKIDVVVAALGGWHQGFSIKDYSFEQWDMVYRNNLTSHFWAIKTFMPLLMDTARYIHINGMGSEQNFPKAGPVLMAAAGQRSLIATLALEEKPRGIHVHEMILGFVNTRKRMETQIVKNSYTPLEISEYISKELIEKESETLTHYLINK